LDDFVKATMVNQQVVDMTVGICSGAITSGLLYPLDTVKTRLQGKFKHV
jgi:hypothetical protein